MPMPSKKAELTTKVKKKEAIKGILQQTADRFSMDPASENLSHAPKLGKQRRHPKNSMA
jgi:hypothetical protein